MTGFFTKEQISEKFTIENRKLLLPECEKCKMYIGCRNPKLNWTGEGRKKCLIVAEANGPEEDNLGKQLIGDVGQYFRDKLAQYNLNLDKDFWKINACNCWPRDSEGHVRKPTKTEVKSCRPIVEKAIKELKPQYIWIMGGTAVESFYMDTFSNTSISRWRRLCIPDRKYSAWIMPLFHPSYPRRQDHAFVSSFLSKTAGER